jgi:uncharacterized membrane protein (DUF485 family)
MLAQMIGCPSQLDRRPLESVIQGDAPQGFPSKEGTPMNALPQEMQRYEASQTEWDRVAASKEFKDLMATKKIFIVPAFVFFIVYYFALPILVGYAPAFMSTKVIGNVNLAYLFALSQFFMAWTIAWLYVKAAGDFDKLAKDIIEKAENRKGA